MINDGTGMINVNYSNKYLSLIMFIPLTCAKYIINNVTGMIEVNYY